MLAIILIRIFTKFITNLHHIICRKWTHLKLVPLPASEVYLIQPPITFCSYRFRSVKGTFCKMGKGHGLSENPSLLFTKSTLKGWQKYQPYLHTYYAQWTLWDWDKWVSAIMKLWVPWRSRCTLTQPDTEKRATFVVNILSKQKETLKTAFNLGALSKSGV